ncbi:MAG: hypothetical protein H0V74_06300 [Chloroflexi bacterium]|nr:hypothetical protein [Chloroflexota bacterium]
MDRVPWPGDDARHQPGAVRRLKISAAIALVGLGSGLVAALAAAVADRLPEETP